MPFLENDRIQIQISLKLVPKRPTDNKPSGNGSASNRRQTITLTNDFQIQIQIWIG